MDKHCLMNVILILCTIVCSVLYCDTMKHGFVVTIHNERIHPVVSPQLAPPPLHYGVCSFAMVRVHFQSITSLLRLVSSLADNPQKCLPPFPHFPFHHGMVYHQSRLIHTHLQNLFLYYQPTRENLQDLQLEGFSFMFPLVV